MVPNICRLRPNRPLLISKVVSLILLYAASVWTDAMEKKVNRIRMGAAYHLTVCVIVGRILVGILTILGIILIVICAYVTGASFAHRWQFTCSEEGPEDYIVYSGVDRATSL